jgi:hypothetical protein
VMSEVNCVATALSRRTFKSGQMRGSASTQRGGYNAFLA